jgi:putative inorganic carbon (HCO3(-)) transporter
MRRVAPLLPWLAAGCLLAFTAYCILGGRFDTLYKVMGLAAAAWLLDTLLYHKRFLIYFTVFLVPFSINAGSDAMGITTSIPSEGLVALFTMLLGFRILLRPSIDRKILTHPLTILMGIDILWLIAASLNSTMPFVSTKRVLVRLAFMIVFYLLFAHLFKNIKNIYKSYLCYAGGLLIIIAYTMRNHANFSFSSASSFAIPQPFFNDHTIYGACIAFVFPLLLILFLKAKSFGFSKWQRNYLGIGAAIFFIAEILSYSRAALLSLIAAGILAYLTRFKISITTIVMTILIVGTSIYVYSDDLIELVAQNEAVSNQGDLTSHYSSVTNLQNDASNLERINRWVCAWRMFETKPMLGYGPGTYQFEYGQFQTAEFTTYISTAHGNRGNAHSEYLTYLAETGWFGLLNFLVLVFVTIATGLKVVYKAKSERVKYLGLAILLGLVTFFTHGLFNAFIDQDKMAVLVFCGIAALVALDRYHLDAEQPKTVQQDVKAPNE